MQVHDAVISQQGIECTANSFAVAPRRDFSPVSDGTPDGGNRKDFRPCSLMSWMSRIPSCGKDACVIRLPAYGLENWLCYGLQLLKVQPNRGRQLPSRVDVGCTLRPTYA